ncbi:hypothetical protein D3C80_2193400 [compost metagenome]
MAICGLQCVPNRKSSGLTTAKKRIASNRSDSTMPMVVRMATSEQMTSAMLTVRSTRLRARRSGSIRPRA